MSPEFEVPLLTADALPQDERAGCEIANSLLYALSAILGRISADVELFEASTRAEALAYAVFKQDWTNNVARAQADTHAKRRFIAARDLSMNAFSFVKTMGALQPRLQTPTLSKLVDWATFNAATALLKTHFDIEKDLHGIRDAVGHQEEIAKDPNDHAVKGSAGLPYIVSPDHVSIVVSGDLHGSTFIYTWDNEVRRIDITTETVAKLTEVRNLIFAAIQPADRALKARFIEMRTGRP
jgi:hypothetical protein